MTCPSTAYQLVLDLQRVERLAVVMDPPACLLHVWRETTGFVTYTSVIGEYGPVTEIREGRKSLPQTERLGDAVRTRVGEMMTRRRCRSLPNKGLQPDCLQRPLRSRFRQRLKLSVRHEFHRSGKEAASNGGRCKVAFDFLYTR